jgi:hypothetical protein
MATFGSGMFLISKMRNLANDFSQGLDLLTVKDILNDRQLVIPSYKLEAAFHPTELASITRRFPVPPV